MRYKTLWYVTNAWNEALRLASIDGTELGSIQAADADVTHVGAGFSLWSDGAIMTNVGLRMPRGGVLSKDTERLLDAVFGSDSPLPKCLRDLLRIDRVAAKGTVLSLGPNGHYAGPTVKELDCIMTDGSCKKFWRFSAGYFEGYAYEIADSRDDIMRIADSYLRPVRAAS